MPGNREKSSARLPGFSICSLALSWSIALIDPLHYHSATDLIAAKGLPAAWGRICH